MKKLIAFTLMFLMGCGSGGGGGSSSGFAGTWRGRFIQVSNGCPIPAGGDFDAVHVVNQDGDRIVVNGTGAFTMEGSTVGADSFLVSRELPRDACETSGDSASHDLILEYTNRTGDNATGLLTEAFGVCGAYQGPVTGCQMLWAADLVRD